MRRVELTSAQVNAARRGSQSASTRRVEPLWERLNVIIQSYCIFLKVRWKMGLLVLKTCVAARVSACVSRHPDPFISRRVQ